MKKVKVLAMLSLVFLLGAGLTNCDNVKDSDLEETAAQIIASNPNTTDVNVSVLDNVATLSGTVEDDATKNRLQSSVLAVEGIKSVVNNINVVAPPPPIVEEPVVEKKSDQLIVATRKGKLNVHNKPGVQEHVIAVVNHGETLTLLDNANDNWWLIQTESGLKGYCSASYLEQK